MSYTSTQKSTSSFKWAAVFALQCALSVALGAFGAHGLSDILDVKALSWWHTANQYLMYHGLAGLMASTLCAYLPAMNRIYVLFFVGNILFAGSLCVMALTGFTVLGAVTPFGGLCYLAAWCGFALRLWRYNVNA